jgi:shikimate kinase
VSVDRAGNPGPLAVLTGPPGAGKSSVGRLLSRLLGVAFRDTDDDIEAIAGKPVSDIFVQDGEPAFRKLEREAVAAALREHRGVLSLGAGAVLDPGTQELLAGHPVVYLDTQFETVARRVGMDRPRPLLIGNPRARLRQLLDERRPIYERLATITVPADDDEPAEIAEDIAARLADGRPGDGGRPGDAGDGPG